MTFICCVPGCGGNENLHSFPKNQLQCKKWIQATWCFHLNEQSAWKTHHKVCRKHFQRADFKNWNLLKKDVIPSLVLPHSITMEHDYSTRNSIAMAVDTADPNRHDCNSAAGENNENVIGSQVDCRTEACAMDVVAEGNQIDDFAGSEFIWESQPDVGQLNECSLEADIGEDNSIVDLTTDRIHRISNKVAAMNAHGDVMKEENPIDELKPCTSKKVSASNEQENLKPKASRTYNPVARKMRYLIKRNKILTKKLKEIQSANLKSNKKSKVKKKIGAVLKTLSLELPPEQYNFIKLQIKNTGKAKTGNRFDFDERTLALVIYKQNPKRYKDLRRISNLPSRQTLIAHSAVIRFKEGLNENLMNFIKAEVSQMEELDKLCTIGWDEISLTANLNFDQIKDFIDGFEDLGSKRTNNFATHALVFMARGIKSPYKQPIAYFLTENINAAELAELIKLVIQAVMDTGLKVIGSVCDAVSTNRSAVNKLIDPKCLRLNTTGKLLQYTINGVKICHYFDPPHLIKSVRNNLLIKDLNHSVSFNETKFRPNGAIVWNEKNKQRRTASWNDVAQFYEFNNNLNNGLFNLIPKITDEHVNPVRRKMKVSLATQVLSGTNGRNMYLCWKRKQFENNCLGTAAVLLFFNELFDSVNGDDVVTLDRLIGAVTTESQHFLFWDYAIRMLDGMEFSTNLKTGKPNMSDVCKHFISTLKGLRQISQHLFELGIKTIGLRRLNQDGLENQFSQIRSYCGSNTKPNARDFRNAFTTSILNSQSTSHSLNANCEPDGDKYVLQNLLVLFDQKKETKTSSGSDSNNIHSQINVDEHCMSTLEDGEGSLEKSFAEDESENCLSGKICKQLLKKMNCSFCSATITVSSNKKYPQHDIIRKQSSVDEIILPKIEFIDCIKIIILKTQKMLPVLCAEKHLMQKLLVGLSFKNNDDALVGCELHRIDFVREMKKLTVKLVIERFTLQVNRILLGRVTVATKCIIQKKALEFRKKKKNIGKFVPPASGHIA